MPLPKPKTDESERDFVSRCMTETAAEFPDQDQRTAVCYEQWRSPDATNKVHYIVNKRSEKAGELLIYDFIGADFFGVTAKQVRADLKAMGNVDAIDVRIFSEGGSVFDGAAIYNALVDTGAKIRVYVDGLAASIASLIAMAGDEILIADNAYMMVHNPWAMCGGDEAAHRKMADLLASVKTTMLRAYAKRTRRDEEEIAALMTDETWMSAEQAVELGFADNIFGGARAAAKLHPDRMHYKNVPSALLQQPQKQKTKRDPRFAQLDAALSRVPNDVRKRYATANGKPRRSTAANKRA